MQFCCNLIALHFQFMDEVVNQECIELNCAELFTSIVQRRSSEDRIDMPRSPKLQIYLIRSDIMTSKTDIDKYCSRQNELTNHVTTIGLIKGDCAVIHRRGKLIFIGGCSGLPLDTVN